MALQTTMLQIDSVDLSPIVSAEEQTLSVQVFLSEILYPDGSVRFAEQGEVTVMLITTDAELSYPAEYLEPGVFEAQIPVENIEPDSYKILVNATLEGALPVAASETVVMYPSLPSFPKAGNDIPYFTCRRHNAEKSFIRHRSCRIYRLPCRPALSEHGAYRNRPR